MKPRGVKLVGPALDEYLEARHLDLPNGAAVRAQQGQRERRTLRAIGGATAALVFAGGVVGEIALPLAYAHKASPCSVSPDEMMRPRLPYPVAGDVTASLAGANGVVRKKIEVVDATVAIGTRFARYGGQLYAGPVAVITRNNRGVGIEGVNVHMYVAHGSDKRVDYGECSMVDAIQADDRAGTTERGARRLNWSDPPEYVSVLVQPPMVIIPPNAAASSRIVIRFGDVRSTNPEVGRVPSEAAFAADWTAATGPTSFAKRPNFNPASPNIDLY